MQARLGITQHLLKNGLATLEEVRGSDGALENVYVRVDREKVLKEGKRVAGELLVQLQVRKRYGRLICSRRNVLIRVVQHGGRRRRSQVLR